MGSVPNRVEEENKRESDFATALLLNMVAWIVYSLIQLTFDQRMRLVEGLAMTSHVQSMVIGESGLDMALVPKPVEEGLVSGHVYVTTLHLLMAVLIVFALMEV